MQVTRVPYRLGPRLADWYHGWRDGRGGIPDREMAAGRITTSHREGLIRLAQEVFEHERLRYERARGDAPERKAAATARLDQLYAHRDDIERHLAEVSRPMSDEEKTWRRVGDLSRDERVVVQRRQTEQRRRIAAARLTLDSSSPRSAASRPRRPRRERRPAGTKGRHDPGAPLPRVRPPPAEQLPAQPDPCASRRRLGRRAPDRPIGPAWLDHAGSVGTRDHARAAGAVGQDRREPRMAARKAEPAFRSSTSTPTGG